MDISFGEIYLFSKNPERLYSFLSFILDLESPNYDREKIEFIFNKIKFVILPTTGTQDFTHQFFSLNVYFENEINELAQNIEFYYYKQSISNYTLDKSSTTLCFTDPDSRKWIVNHVVQYDIPDHIASDVRIC